MIYTGNRGMAFEKMIDYTNSLYEQKGIALINKRPTPVKILGTNRNGMIHGFVERPSTVDYDGVYKGRSIVFEAKSVSKLDRFDLKNIHDHQVEYLVRCDQMGAISFLLVEFSKHRTVYLMSAETLDYYWNRKQRGGRKSISLDEVDVHAHEVMSGRVPVDYLAVVKKVWGTKIA